MNKVRGLLGYLYRHNLIRYLLVGGSTFIIDLVLLVMLHGHLKINISVAASIAYWTSILYNFILNRWWTFSASESKKLHQHIIPYAILLGCNYLFTVLFVSIVSRHFNYVAVKVVAVLLQTLWTYRIYKNVIFADSTKVNIQE